MNQDRITVVTVTYNAEEVLEETILSVINQSYKNIEYIIIDGASTDGTVDIIKKYEDHIDYWISEPDEGIYYAMNKGIEKANGEWINFMNAGDNFFNTDTIGMVISSLNRDTDIIFGDHVQNGKICSVKGRKITRLIPCCHQSLFIRTEIHKLYPYNTMYKISADYESLLKMYLDGKIFQYIQQPIASYKGGGFSDANQARWYIEVLTLLTNNNIPLNDIIKSSAYYLISNISELNKLRDERSKTKSLEENCDHMMKQLSKLQHIQTWQHPIKKLKAYKNLLTLCQKCKPTKIEIQENDHNMIFTVDTAMQNIQIAYYLYHSDKHVDTRWYSKNLSYAVNRDGFEKGKYRIQYFIVDGDTNDPGKEKKLEIGYSEYIYI